MYKEKYGGHSGPQGEHKEGVAEKIGDKVKSLLGKDSKEKKEASY